jgi:hypothetical protein
MLSIIVVGTAVAVALGLAGSIANNSSFWLSNYNPSDKKIQDDFSTMKVWIEPKLKAIIPWTDEELSILSLEQIDIKTKKEGTYVMEGTFISIYHEPMVTYIYKKYINKKFEDAIIFARTSNRAFQYRIKQNEVVIHINNHPIGTLKANGQLFNKNKRIASINKDNPTTLYAISLHDKRGQTKELGSVVNKYTAEQVNNRAFQLLDESMNDNEEAIFLALALYEMIHRSVKR